MVFEPDGACAPSGTFPLSVGCLRRAGRGEHLVPQGDASFQNRRSDVKTDIQLDTLLGADAEFLRLLTNGIEVRGDDGFEALEVKGLNRRSDGVLSRPGPRNRSG